MKKKKIIIVILALVIALIITALIVNQVIDKYDKSSIEFENKVVNEINSINEIQETEANVVENTSINQDTKEELIQEDTNANTKTETQENKNEKQTESTKSTQEKVVESPKQTEKPTQVTNKVDTPKNNTQKGEKPKENIQENKNDDKVQEKPKCTDTKHGVSAGNSNLWFNSYDEAVAYYDNLINGYSDQVHNGEISSDEYYKLCPYGYETWSCPYCGKWTLNYYKR